MKAGEAPHEKPQLFFGQDGFDAREHLVLFEADVVVEKLAKRGQLRLDVPLCGQARGKLFNASPNGCVLGKHPHHGRLGVEGDVAGERRQQHLLLFAEVQASGSLPEAEVVASDATDSVVAPAG